MKALKIGSIICILFLVSCTKHTINVKEAETVFENLIHASVENTIEQVELYAPFVHEMQEAEKQVIVSIFQSFDSGAVIKNFKSISSDTVVVSVYVPEEKLQLEMNMQKNDDGSWIVLPQWQRAVSIDTITLD